MDWFDSPKSISNFGGVDCLFAIDENGTSSMEPSALLNENDALFTITGVHIEMDKYNKIRDEVMSMKNEYWNEATFHNKRVVFHSRDIRKKQGAFNPKIINHSDFNEDLNNFLSNLPVEVYSATIDKKAHFKQYTNPFPVYELGVEFILERFCFDLRRNNKTGIILLESRGLKEDTQVLNKIKNLLSEGNRYVRDKDFSVIKGVYFNKKRTSDGKLSHWPLELVDLISYKIYSYVKNGVADDDFSKVATRIYGYPNFNGKGLKVFP